MLGRVAILEGIKKGQIVCTPFKESQVSHNSIDVTLGEFLWIPLNKDRVVFKPYADNPRSWYHMLTLTQDAPSYTLKPGESIIGHTHEFVGTSVKDITSKIRAKSTTAAHGLTIGADAGLGDPGWISRWGMRITNLNPYPVILTKGLCIAQIYFQKVEKANSSYEATKNVMPSDWFPELLLPKPLKVVKYGIDSEDTNS